MSSVCYYSVCVCWGGGTKNCSACWVLQSHRGVLALDAGGVEADGRDTLHLPLDVEHTLVVLLARLRLRQVPGPQRDRTDHPGRDQDVGGGEDLRAALWEGWGRGKRGGVRHRRFGLNYRRRQNTLKPT